MPDGRSVRRNADVKKPLNEPEKALKDRRQREVLLHLFVRKTVALLTEFFRGPGLIPGLHVGEREFLARVGFKFRFVFLCPGFGAGREVTEKMNDFGGRLRHLGGKRHFGKILKPEEFGFFLTQLEQLLNHRAVVFFLGTEFRGPRHKGAVDRFAERAVCGIFHHRQINRVLQRDAPAVDARGLGGLCHQGLVTRGDSFEFLFVGDVKRPGVCGIKKVLIEFLRERCRLFAAGLQFCLFVCGKVGARQTEVPHLVLKQALFLCG